jgi:hypothetical protein
MSTPMRRQRKTRNSCKKSQSCHIKQEKTTLAAERKWHFYFLRKSIKDLLLTYPSSLKEIVGSRAIERNEGNSFA